MEEGCWGSEKQVRREERNEDKNCLLSDWRRSPGLLSSSPCQPAPPGERGAGVLSSTTGTSSPPRPASTTPRP